MDAWLLLRNVEFNGERNRTLYVLKARGIPHSNQVREFILSNQGISLVDVYLGSDGVLTGAARTAQETQEALVEGLREQEQQKRLRTVTARRKALAAQIEALQAEMEMENAEESMMLKESQWRSEITGRFREKMSKMRSQK